MKRLVKLARHLPFALLLSLAMTFQAFTSVKHAQAALYAASGELQTIIVCADGELQEIVIDDDGDPVDGNSRNIPNCPLCLAAGKLFIHHSVQVFDPVELAISKANFEAFKSEIFISRQPDRLDCLGPPSTS